MRSLPLVSAMRGKIFARHLPELAMACICLALPALAGCGASSGPMGKIHGKVTFEGKPVTAGATVSFLGASGAAASGIVDSDGGYQVVSTAANSLPTGTYKVLVNPPANQTLSDEARMKASMPTDPKKNPLAPKAADPTIPEKYRSITATTLSYEIKEGDNEIDIELKAD